MNDSIPPAVAPASSDANGFSFAFPFAAADEDDAAADMICFFFCRKDRMVRRKEGDGKIWRMMSCDR